MAPSLRTHSLNTVHKSGGKKIIKNAICWSWVILIKKKKNVITILCEAFCFGLGTIRYSVTKEHLLGFLFNPSFYFPVIPSRARVEARWDLILSFPVLPWNRWQNTYTCVFAIRTSQYYGRETGWTVRTVDPLARYIWHSFSS